MSKPINIKDSVLPCLLDRLTDKYPKAETENIEQRVISVSEYKKNILRDLSFLLNSNSHLQANEFGNNNEAENSVLSYGVNSICGALNSPDKKKAIEKNIESAIKLFEPRINRESLHVSLVNRDSANSSNSIEIIIKAKILPLFSYRKMYIKTIIDLETGSCKLKENKANG